MSISIRVKALALLSSGFHLSFAQVVPTTPGPNETYNADSNCTIAWESDSTGTWKNMTIDLMSGPNNNMSYVTNVAMGLDGTDSSLTPYVWSCPEVDPYSAIYFYQFTNGNDIMNRTWTTRFTVSNTDTVLFISPPQKLTCIDPGQIASPANQTTLPTNSQQPSGERIPWGIGFLKSKSALSTPDSSTLRDPDNTNSINNTTPPNGEAETDDNENANDPPQTLELTPEAPTPTQSKSRSAHGHKTTDAPDDEDGSATESSDNSGREAVAKTKTANIQAERSQAARASAVAQGYTGTDSSSDPIAPAGRSANAAAQNDPSSQLGASSDTNCRCNTVNSSTNRARSSRVVDLNMAIALLLLVVTGLATILV